MNMWDYDNRARVFLHEVTHLDFFVNAPAEVPPVDDLTIRIKVGKVIHGDRAYGPFRAKVLTNWRTKKKAFTPNGMVAL